MLKKGRPSIFSETVADQICCYVAEGQSLRRIAKQAAMPSPSTIVRWTQDPDKQAFTEQYRIARQIGWEVLADDLLELPDRVVTYYRDAEGNERIDAGSVNLARLKCQNLMWVLSKLLPKKYGNNTEVEPEKPFELKRYMVELIPKRPDFD